MRATNRCIFLTTRAKLPAQYICANARRHNARNSPPSTRTPKFDHMHCTMPAQDAPVLSVLVLLPVQCRTQSVHAIIAIRPRLRLDPFVGKVNHHCVILEYLVVSTLSQVLLGRLASSSGDDDLLPFLVALHTNVIFNGALLLKVRII